MADRPDEHEGILERFGLPAGVAVPTTAPASEIRGSEQKVIQRRPAPMSVSRTAEAEQVIQRHGGGLTSWSVRDVMPLLIVLVILGVAVWIVKRFIPGRRLLGGAGGLQVLTRMPLSNKQALVLVKMGRQVVLLGVSPERINALNVVSDPDQVATLVGQSASTGPDSMVNTFARAFTEANHEYAQPESNPPETKWSGSADQGVRDLLNKVRGLVSKSGDKTAGMQAEGISSTPMADLSDGRTGLASKSRVGRGGRPRGGKRPGALQDGENTEVQAVSDTDDVTEVLHE